ncbi:hypothetical protein [Oryzifoliimicrobium ureilyticus]|uniref:hypothetical protein n=1 Tax=Oryzifoliimicrobium ureilyticus TaxID=3113724 RepID=UPI003075F4CA
MSKKSIANSRKKLMKCHQVHGQSLFTFIKSLASYQFCSSGDEYVEPIGLQGRIRVSRIDGFTWDLPKRLARGMSVLFYQQNFVARGYRYNIDQSG